MTLFQRLKLELFVCDFLLFSKVFQTYQDVGCVIMKGGVCWNPVYDWKDPAYSGSRARNHLISRQPFNLLSYRGF